MNRTRVQGIQKLRSAMALITAFGLAPTQAKAELVVEGQTPAAPVMTADTAADPTPVVKVVVPAPVQQVAVPSQPYPAQPYPVQPYPVQPIVIAAPQAPVVAQAAAAQTADSNDRTSRTELVRRERMREEVRNEDILQERLEELRLQDEKRRTGQVLGVTPDVAAAPSALLATATPVAKMVTEQVVSVPVTERSPGNAGYGTSGGLNVSISSASVSDAPVEEVTTLRLAPRGGMSGFSGQNPYAMQGRYSIGAGLDVGVSDHLTFEMGYTFSEYGVALNSATALGLTPVLGAGGYGFNYDANTSTGAFKQNVVDAGLKIHLLGRQSKLRPFIGGGAGYSRSYLNYDPRIVDFLRRAGYGVSPDYELNQFLANASAGMELQLSKSVVVGLSYKYYTVLSSRQNQDLYNPALYGGYTGAYYGGYGYGGLTGPGSLADLDKQYVGGSLATTSFYSIMATLGFSF